MIPVGDSAPRWRWPWVNYTIIAITGLAFLFELSLGGRLDAFIQRFGVTPALIAAELAGNPRVPRGVLWTLVTALFLHAGWMHLLGNMLFLWIFGDNVEDRLGHFRYLLFYLLCGVGANLAQVFVEPASRVPLIGASGAIAGVLGAYLLLYPRAWVTVLVPIFVILWPLDIPVFIMLGIWFLSQLASGVAAITQASAATGGVGWWAHVGGFLLGMLLLVAFPKAPAGPAQRSAPSARRTAVVPEPGAARWLLRAASFAGDAVSVLIGARILLVLLEPAEGRLLRAVARLVMAITLPLVEPFVRFLPAVRLGGSVLELYAVLALVVYYILVALLVWMLTAAMRPSAPRHYYRRLD
jgi:membrane associated rhomboid family serine protease